MNAATDGLLLVHKPAGPTSHDIVELVRSVLGQRVGHTGTLDPGASGLLLLVLGRATRMARYLPHSPKLYTGTLRLGLTTKTDDVWGEVVHRFSGVLPCENEVRARAAELRGRILQIPPAVSAKKVGGRRLYRLAHEGRAIQAVGCWVEVFHFEIEPCAEPGQWSFTAEVSAGTYVRSLVRDLGAKLGCGGALESLCRTAIGPIRLESALVIEGPAQRDAETLRACTIPLEAMPFEPMCTRLEEPEASTRFSAGLPVSAPRGVVGCGTCMVFDRAGKLLGVAESVGDSLRPSVVLAPPVPGGATAERRRQPRVS